jgi:hypothetical protein
MENQSEGILLFPFLPVLGVLEFQPRDSRMVSHATTPYLFIIFVLRKGVAKLPMLPILWILLLQPPK